MGDPNSQVKSWKARTIALIPFLLYTNLFGKVKSRVLLKMKLELQCLEYISQMKNLKFNR